MEKDGPLDGRKYNENGKDIQKGASHNKKSVKISKCCLKSESGYF